MAAHPIRVLLVDDDEDYLVLTRALLSEVEGEQYELDWRSTATAALEALRHNAYDVCLLDHHLGEATGLDLLRAALTEGCTSPMIMLTGQGDHEVDLEAMRAGAADYLVKGRTDAAGLERSIRYAIGRAQTLEALHESKRHVAELYLQEQERRQELERAYTDLRRLESMRDDLTHMIVHDLRNPLTSINTYLELTHKALNSPAHAEAPPRFLAGAKQASQRMIRMIDDLLSVSKFEAGELQPRRVPVNLSTLLADKADAYRLQAEREEKTFTIHAPAQLPMVRADSELVARVIDNLVTNAFKYTSSGGSIAIAVEQKDQMLMVTIRDDGEGIPSEYHHRIFEKFAQVTDGAGVPLRKGTGLGLAFCRLAVEAHGGQIWVDSVPGQGSAFSFTLPE